MESMAALEGAKELEQNQLKNNADKFFDSGEHHGPSIHSLQSLPSV